MLYYALISFGILCLAPLDKQNKKQKKTFIILSFILVAFFAAARGDFTSDYRSYYSFFQQIKEYSFGEIWNTSFYTEKGFVLFNKLISLFTNSSVFFIAVMSVIIVFLYYKEFEKKSQMMWFSVLLFVGIGGYYDSFNISRQILAAAIVFSGSKYLYQKEPAKYFMVAVLASFFHRSALLMIPCYYILTLKVNKVKTSLVVIMGLVLVLAIQPSIQVFQKLFPVYAGYTYGMTGGSINAIFLPIIILLFLSVSFFLKQTEFHMNQDGNNVLVNGLILYSIFIILGTQVQMTARMAYFFQPYLCLLIPNYIDSYKNTKAKTVLILLVSVLSILYPLITLSGTGYDPYYFIWGK